MTLRLFFIAAMATIALTIPTIGYAGTPGDVTLKVVIINNTSEFFSGQLASSDDSDTDYNGISASSTGELNINNGSPSGGVFMGTNHLLLMCDEGIEGEWTILTNANTPDGVTKIEDVQVFASGINPGDFDFTIATSSDNGQAVVTITVSSGQ